MFSIFIFKLELNHHFCELLTFLVLQWEKNKLKHDERTYIVKILSKTNIADQNLSTHSTANAKQNNNKLPKVKIFFLIERKKKLHMFGFSSVFIFPHNFFSCGFVISFLT